MLTAEEKGRFKVRVLPEMEPLKMLPVVPVANTVTPVSVAAKVICPAVVVVMVMLLPATRLVGAYLAPVPSAARICPVTVGAVEVAVPPLATPKTPETSLLPKATAALKRFPDAVLLTGRAEERELIVVEPETVRVPETPKVETGEVELIPTFPALITVRNWVPVELAMESRLLVDPPVPWTENRLVGVALPIPTLPPNSTAA